MKIRSGFVSNSSSSSFIINGDGEDALLTLAKITIAAHEQKGFIPVSVNQVAEEFLRASNRMETLSKLLEQKKKFDYIVFRTVNYPTEIFYLKPFTTPEDPTIFISTCNNEWDSWEQATRAIEHKYSIKVISRGENGYYDHVREKFRSSHEKYFYSGTGYQSNGDDYDYLNPNINFEELEKSGYDVMFFPDYEDGELEKKEKKEYKRI
jgi:hypothetical protein